MAQKVPLTARIRPDLALLLEQEAKGEKSKTDILECALEKHFHPLPGVSPEFKNLMLETAIQAVKIALGDTDVIRAGDAYVIQGDCVTDAIPGDCVTGVIRGLCDTGEIKEVCDRVISEVHEETEEVREAFVLVRNVNDIRSKEGCNLKKACKIAGCSDKKYYSRVKLLKEKGIDSNKPYNVEIS